MSFWNGCMPSVRIDSVGGAFAEAQARSPSRDADFFSCDAPRRRILGSVLRHTPVMIRGTVPLALSKTVVMGLGGRMRASLAALAAVLCAASSAQAAEPIAFLICQPGGPQLNDEQKAVMAPLFRHLEKKLGLEDGQFQHRYENSARGCDKALADKPAVILPSVPIFVEKRRALNLMPVAQLKVNGQTRDHFYVMTSADAEFGLAGLIGKTVMGTHLDSPRFLADGVFGGEVKPEQLVLKPTKTAVRAINRVIRGRADAVVLDGTQYRALDGSRYEQKLKLLHTSPLVPTPPVTVVEGRVPADFARRLGRALVGMAADPGGQKVLKAFKIEGFEATSLQQWAKLEARLNHL